MTVNTANTNIAQIKEIIPPNILNSTYIRSEDDTAFIQESRQTITDILLGKDKRFLVIVGPCSIHDADTAIEYAKRLKTLRDNNQTLFIVMRVYFEKPRSRTGWKGYIYDPDLNNTFNINKGLTQARKLLLEITNLRIPIGCEFLDTITPQYLSDLVSWGAIGARTSESQIHRQLASGLSMPIGFKNLTSGDYEKAIDGIISSQYSHNFLGIDDEGKVSQVITKGSQAAHLILRGGQHAPNYDQATVGAVSQLLTKEKISTGIIVDCSHGNSQKEYNRQILVAIYTRRQHIGQSYTNTPIRGIMLESNIHKGAQKLSNTIHKGVSITDACIDFETTESLLHILNNMTLISNKDTTLGAARDKIRHLDICIYNILHNTFNYSERTKEELAPIQVQLRQQQPQQLYFHEDSEVAILCKGHPREELLLIYVSLRLAHSENIAAIKYREDPFKYLYNKNDFLNEIIDRNVEKGIMETFKDPIYLKIMELSKTLQVKYLEAVTRTTTIGYLFGRGTFSHEAVTENFRGEHIAFPSVGALKASSVDFILLPTYNSIIGEIFPVDRTLTCGLVNHPVELNLYSNRETVVANKHTVLYVEPHIEKEAANYIKTLKIENSIHVGSSLEGCKKIIDCAEPSYTIASKKNESNLYYTVATDIVKHNITTFSLVRQTS